MSRRLFTSGSVTEVHSDTIAREISDAILNALLWKHADCVESLRGKAARA